MELFKTDGDTLERENANEISRTIFQQTVYPSLSLAEQLNFITFELELLSNVEIAKRLIFEWREMKNTTDKKRKSSRKNREADQNIKPSLQFETEKISRKMTGESIFCGGNLKVSHTKM